MSSIRVDLALSGEVSERAIRLLALAEDQWFDRKSARIAPKDLARHLVAFANAEGGTIVLGLSKKFGIERITPAQDNAFRQASIDFTEPPVRVACESANVEAPDGTVEDLLLIRVAPGERVHRTVGGGCYLRVGDESRHLTFPQEHELLYDRGQAQYDGEPALGATDSDIDGDLLSGFALAIGHPDAGRVLNARNLLTRDGAITNAAILLFGTNPTAFFPQAYVRVLRYQGRERGTGVRLNIIAGGDHRVEGDLPGVITAAQALIEQLIPKRRALGGDGRFADIPIVPRDAWLEGLVNAVVHRSYSLAGDYVRVEIFTDRIEIESPGRFPGLVDIERPLKIARFARNPRVARTCADLRITLELGEGIKRMFEEMRLAGLEDPLYQQTSGSVRLALTALARLDPQIEAQLPPGASDVLRLLQRSDGRRLGTGDVAEATGTSRPTAVKRLSALRDAGLIDWNGNSARDPRAYWTVR